MERLFETEDAPRGRTSVPPSDQPLAVRMRPATLSEFIGQEHLLGEGSALRTALEEGRPHSMILYGPPGTGKTTLARLLALNSRAAFEEASAVNAGRQEVRDVLERAPERGVGAEQVLLPDQLVDRRRAHADRQRTLLYGNPRLTPQRGCVTSVEKPLHAGILAGARPYTRAQMAGA